MANRVGSDSTLKKRAVATADPIGLSAWLTAAGLDVRPCVIGPIVEQDCLIRQAEQLAFDRPAPTAPALRSRPGRYPPRWARPHLAVKDGRRRLPPAPG